MSDTKSDTTWYPACRVSPAKFGMPGWQMLMGCALHTDYDKARLQAPFVRMNELLPHFLMCIWCSGHFYRYQHDRPKPEGMSCFQWMHEAWLAVSDRSYQSDDETWTDLYLKERWQSHEEIRTYYETRLSVFRSLWLHQVLVFLTTMMRALPAPENWSPSLAENLVEFLTCIHLLLRSSFASPFHTGLQASSQTWSVVWQEWMARQLGGGEKGHWEALLVDQTSSTLALTRLPLSGVVSFLGQEK